MSEPFIDELTRELLERIDARLLEAERLRNHIEQRSRQVPFWPDRRRPGRVPWRTVPAAVPV